MSRGQRLWLLSGAALVSVTLTGCMSSSPRFGGAVDDRREADAAYEEFMEDQQAEQAARQAEEEAEMGPPGTEGENLPWIDGSAEPSGVRGTWVCHFAPTMNDDWHDDVVCSNGVDAHRPYLRPWDNFVEEWEMADAAAEYEAELNASG